MTNLETLLLTLFLGENGLLITALYFYWHRKCSKCQRVKNIDQIFAKLCPNCQPSKKEEKIEIF